MARCNLIVLTAAGLGLALGCASHARDDRELVSAGSSPNVRDLRGTTLAEAQARTAVESLDAPPSQRALRQHSTSIVGKGAFLLRATVVVDEFGGKGCGISFDGGTVVLDDPEWGAVLMGRVFGGGRFALETSRPPSARNGAPIEVEIGRDAGSLFVRLNEVEMGRLGMNDLPLGRVGFDLGGGRMRVLAASVAGDIAQLPIPLAIYSSADGDIDEYREPSAASDGKSMIVTAVAVSTAENGATSTALHSRRCDAEARFGPDQLIALGAVEVDIAVLGCTRQGAKPWKLLIQERAERRVVDRLLAYESADGTIFSKAAEIAISTGRVQLVANSMQLLSEGRLAAGATRVGEGEVRAAVVEFDGVSQWTVRDLDSSPGCEPMWISADKVMVRIPRQADREILAATGRSPAVGFEGGAASFGVLDSSSGGGFGIAQSGAGFPYILQELVTVDGGLKWSVGRTVWGGSAGNAISAEVGSERLLVFEGGDRARREHVLVVRFPRSSPTAPAAPVPPPTPTSILAPKVGEGTPLPAPR
jgi:hypothetical protein